MDFNVGNVSCCRPKALLEVMILGYSLVAPCKYLAVGTLLFYFMLDLTESVSKDAARVLPVTG